MIALSTETILKAFMKMDDDAQYKLIDTLIQNASPDVAALFRDIDMMDEE